RRRDDHDGALRRHGPHAAARPRRPLGGPARHVPTPPGARHPSGVTRPAFAPDAPAWFDGRMADEAHEHISVAASPSRLWEVATDYERYPTWARDVKQVE